MSFKCKSVVQWSCVRPSVVNPSTIFKRSPKLLRQSKAVGMGMEVRSGFVLVIGHADIYLVQKETQCFYLQFLGLKLLISTIVLI